MRTVSQKHVSLLIRYSLMRVRNKLNSVKNKCYLIKIMKKRIYFNVICLRVGIKLAYFMLSYDR